MYYKELIKIIEKVLNEEIDKENLEECLIDSLDCEKIYESDDKLLTDAFFSLKHYASGEEEFSKNEWLYFKACLQGERKYNVDEKMRITMDGVRCEK